MLFTQRAGKARERRGGGRGTGERPEPRPRQSASEAYFLQPRAIPEPGCDDPENNTAIYMNC